MNINQAGSPVTPTQGNWFPVLIVLSLLSGSSAILFFQTSAASHTTESPTSTPSTPKTPILAAKRDKIEKLGLFANWPQQKPEMVLVLTGQMYGYLQKCGCSNPQKGGLERRYNFLDYLRVAKGWEVVPLDLGDLSSADRTKLGKQALLKYQVAMESLSLMGYRAVGLGVDEFRLPLIDGLATFTLQDPAAYPKVHAANLADRVKNFPSTEANRSMILSSDVYNGKSLDIGIVGLLGKSIFEDIQKIDSKVSFVPRSNEVLKESLKEINQKKKNQLAVNVLLYQGDFEDAQLAAKMFPEFQIVVCRSVESEPPTTPTKVNDSLIFRVGHKGQNIGVLGIFKENGKLTYYYERVTISEDFETPADREAEQPILQKYEWYAKEVRDRKFLQQFPKTSHPMQAAFPNQAVAYVGSETCRNCHGGEYLKWSDTKHAHAYEALEKIAKHPSMRNFDGECIVCHTVGFNYNTGFDGTPKTVNLKHNGCENCHGPGSLHSQNPNNKAYLPYLSPWKIDAKDQLPSAEVMAKLLDAKTPEERAKLITVQEEKVLLRVDAICQKCHDSDNDPHYRFEAYWPKVIHKVK